jgi:hypothetical protein
LVREERMDGSVANKEQVEMLKRGVRAWNEWQMGSGLIDLSGANLSGLDLSSIDVHTHLELSLAKLTYDLVKRRGIPPR